VAERRRWDTDEQFVGVRDAGIASMDVEHLLAKTREPGWVTEDAASHLGPSCLSAAKALDLEIVRLEVMDDVLEVDLRVDWGDEAHPPRVAGYGLIGAFAEASTYVRERRGAGGEVVLEVVTGVLPGDSFFASHGHLARLRLLGAND
jgi:hypothetical protein